MRKHLIAALLGCTALTVPQKAQADPVSGFLVGIATTATGGAVAVGASASVLAGAAFAASTFGGIVINAVVGIGLSAIAAALQPRPEIPKPAARMVNFAQPIAYAEYAFGRVRKGGPLGFSKFNQARYYAPILAAHPCEGVVTHYIDERIVTLNSDGIASSPDVNLGDKCKITFYDGGTGQAADPELLTQFDGDITSAHNFARLTYAVVRAKKTKPEQFSKIYPAAVPWAYTPVFDGHNEIYDPRGATSTGYSNNSALVLAYWIVNILGQQVDWALVAIEADACDVTVTNKEGGTQAKWTTNGVLSEDMDYETQRAQIAVACDAFIYEPSDGKVGFYVGRYIAPTLTLTGSDFITMTISEGQAGPDAPTEIAAEYIEPLNGWRQTSSGAYVATTATRQVRETPQLFMVNSHNQASRINKRIARTARSQYQVTGTLGVVGYELIGQRFITIQNTEVGLDQVFEIGKLVREGISTFSLTANSVNATDFAFDASTEEPTRPLLNNDTLDATDTVPNVVGLSVANIGGGTIRVSWTDSEDFLGQQIRVGIVGQSLAIAQLYDVPISQQPFEISGLAGGSVYRVDIRNRVGGLFDTGSYTPDPPVEVTIVTNPTAPNELSGAASSAGDPGEINTTWVSANDANQFSVRVYRGTTTVFADATLVATIITAPNQTSGHIDTGLTAGTFYSWLAPVNGSGVQGAISGPFTVTVT